MRSPRLRHAGRKPGSPFRPSKNAVALRRRKRRTESCAAAGNRAIAEPLRLAPPPPTHCRRLPACFPPCRSERENHNLIRPAGSRNCGDEICDFMPACQICLPVDGISRLRELVFDECHRGRQRDWATDVTRADQSGQPVDVPAQIFDQLAALLDLHFKSAPESAMATQRFGSPARRCRLWPNTRNDRRSNDPSVVRRATT